MLRFPEGMRDRIAASAAESGRSMNAEIIDRLQVSYEPGLMALPWPDLLAMLQKEAAERGAVVTITLGK